MDSNVGRTVPIVALVIGVILLLMAFRMNGTGTALVVGLVGLISSVYGAWRFLQVGKPQEDVSRTSDGSWAKRENAARTDSDARTGRSPSEGLGRAGATQAMAGEVTASAGNNQAAGKVVSGANDQHTAGAGVAAGAVPGSSGGPGANEQNRSLAESAAAYRAANPSNFAQSGPTCSRCGNVNVVRGTCQNCGAYLFPA